MEDEDEERLRNEYVNLLESTEIYFSEISKKLKEKYKIKLIKKH